MKQLIFSLVLCSSFTFLKAQSETQIDSWFLNIPINKESKTIHDHLVSDPEIISIVDKTISGGDKFRGEEFLFAGKFNRPVKLQSTLPDSVRVEQTYGLMKSETQKIVGKTKNIKVEYFFSDTSVLRRVYEAAFMDLTTGIRKRDVHRSRFTLNGESFDGYFFYFQNRKKFKRGEVLLGNMSANGGSLIITYSEMT